MLMIFFCLFPAFFSLLVFSSGAAHEVSTEGGDLRKIPKAFNFLLPEDFSWTKCSEDIRIGS